MKKSLLATVAAVALIAGAGIASAAEGGKDRPAAAAAGHAEMNKAPAKAETTGAGPSTEMKSEPKAEMKAEPKADTKADTKADVKADTKADTKASADKAKPSTTSQASEQKAAPAAKSAADDKAGTAKSASDSKATPAAKSATDEKASPNAKSASDSKAAPANGTAQTSEKSSTSVSLTTEQRTQIRTTVLQSGNAPKVSRSSINFNISVGTVVPRSVHFVTVPDTIVTIHPAWRGYSYFVVDEEIIIIEPGTFRIVAVLNV